MLAVGARRWRCVGANCYYLMVRPRDQAARCRCKKAFAHPSNKVPTSCKPTFKLCTLHLLGNAALQPTRPTHPQTRAADPTTRHEVEAVLDAARALGLGVLRTWAFNDGPEEWNAVQRQPGESEIYELS